MNNTIYLNSQKRSKNPFNPKILGLIAILIVAAAVPTTIFLAQNRQNSEQFASTIFPTIIVQEFTPAPPRISIPIPSFFPFISPSPSPTQEPPSPSEGIILPICPIMGSVANLHITCPNCSSQ